MGKFYVESKQLKVILQAVDHRDAAMAALVIATKNKNVQLANTITTSERGFPSDRDKDVLYSDCDEYHPTRKIAFLCGIPLKQQ
jgi:hypothetical protein